MEIVLATELESFVNRKIASGVYDAPSEMVNEGLRLLQERDTLERIRFEELRRDILLGLEGERIPLDIEAIIAEAERRFAQKGKQNGAS